MVEHTAPRPQPFNRSWKSPLYIKTTNALPAASSNMTHVRKHWPQQQLGLFEGETLKCLFTSGGLLACPSVVCDAPGSLKSSGGARRWCSIPPRERAGRRPCWQHLLNAHGQNQAQRVWSGRTCCSVDFCGYKLIVGPVDCTSNKKWFNGFNVFYEALWMALLFKCAIQIYFTNNYHSKGVRIQYTFWWCKQGDIWYF